MNFPLKPGPDTVGARDFTDFSRIGSEVGALYGALAYAGVTKPDGNPLSEALSFAIGGGIGLGYFVYESGDYTSLFIATRLTTTEKAQAGFLFTILENLGVPFRKLTATTPAAAHKKLLAELDQGRPVVVYLDPRQLPYPHPPATYHTLLVLGWEAGRQIYWVADRAGQALPLQGEVLGAARQGEGATKARALVVDRASGSGSQASLPVEKLRAALQQGLQAGSQQMRKGFGPPNLRGNFGLAGLEKWARLLVDAKDPRGWPKFFPPGPRLFNALLSAYEQIQQRGGGAALRPLFADCLEEAAGLLELPALNQAAGRYREAAGLWGSLAQSLLPDEIPQLAQARLAVDHRQQNFLKTGEGERQAGEQVPGGEFPLDAAETGKLLESVQEKVLAVHKSEATALEVLESALGGGLKSLNFN